MPGDLLPHAVLKAPHAGAHRNGANQARQSAWGIAWHVSKPWQTSGSLGDAWGLQQSMARGAVAKTTVARAARRAVCWSQLLNAGKGSTLSISSACEGTNNVYTHRAACEAAGPSHTRHTSPRPRQPQHSGCPHTRACPASTAQHLPTMCTTVPPAKSRKRQVVPALALSHDSGFHTQCAITGCTSSDSTAVYTGYANRCVRSARQPEAMVTHDSAKVQVKNQGLVWRVSPSVKKLLTLGGGACMRVRVWVPAWGAMYHG